MTELTTSQAHDCARYFIGPEWMAWQRNATCILGHKEQGIVHMGDSWRDVFRQANVRLPSRRDFEPLGLTVRRRKDNHVVARCDSKTFAQRTANALNEYVPGERGY